MKTEARRFAVLLAITLVIIAVGVVMQFNSAANSIAIFKTDVIASETVAGQLERALLDRGGISSIQVNAPQGIVIVVFDARAVDPRSVASSVSRMGLPMQAIEVMSMQDYRSLIGGSNGCGSSSCGNCSQTR